MTVNADNTIEVVTKRKLYTSKGVKEVMIKTIYERFTDNVTYQSTALLWSVAPRRVFSSHFMVIRYVGLTPSVPRLPDARVAPVSIGLSDA